MLIIVEGADCSGKTTLVNAIAQELGVENTQVLRKGPPTHFNPVVEYLWPLAGYVPGGNKHIVCDRWHVGELVYPKILRRSSIMTPDRFDMIHKILGDLGAIVVYLEPPLSVIHERFHKRGDKLIKDIDTLSESYFQFRVVTSRFKFDYDPKTIRFNNVDFDHESVKAITWTA